MVWQVLFTTRWATLRPRSQCPPGTLSARLDLLVCHELTKRGEDFLQVLAAMLQWSARHYPHSAVPRAMRRRVEKDFIGLVESFRLQARR